MRKFNSENKKGAIMKKGIAVAVIASVFTASGAFAADTTSLTRAVVKLIKANHQVNLMVHDINVQLKDHDKRISENKAAIDMLRDSLKKTDEKVSSNSSRISAIENSLKDIDKKAESARESASEAKKLVDEMRNMSVSFKNKSGEVVTSAKMAYQRVISLEKKISAMRESLYEIGRVAHANKSAIQALEKRLNRLEAEYSAKISKANSKISSLENRVSLLETRLNALVDGKPVAKTAPASVVESKCSIGCEDDEKLTKEIKAFIGE